MEHKSSTKIKPSQLKVAVISISLANGGAEKSTALLTTILDQLGFDVHVVTINKDIFYTYSGKLFNLGLDKSPSDNLFNQFGYLRKLKLYLKNENIHLIIDNRTRPSVIKEFIYLFYIYSGKKIIYVVRSANLQKYFPKSRWLTNVMINKSFKIVGVSKAISEKINVLFKTNKATTIYNSVAINNVKASEKASKYVLFMGRIDNHAKNFQLLLAAYTKSVLPERNIELRIYGDGSDKIWLENRINDLRLSEKIKLFDFTSDVEAVMTNALFVALTSNYEGFPRVLIESLAVGTPVISVDCESGPNEIIKHEFNGLLVENDNTTALANAFNRFIFESDLYNYCKSNAQNSIHQFTQPIIAQQWKELLSRL